MEETFNKMQSKPPWFDEKGTYSGIASRMHRLDSQKSYKDNYQQFDDYQQDTQCGEETQVGTLCDQSGYYEVTLQTTVMMNEIHIIRIGSLLT